jgi:hypothetical protein
MAGKISLERAAEFVWGNARRVERAVFARMFGDGSAGDVHAALGAYRNADGGFGHALEPDVRAPDSMPLHVEVALRSLEMADAGTPELSDEICGYLTSIAEPGGRVPIVLPAVLEYPRAGHWNEPLFGGDSINPTGALAGLLRAQGGTHAWLRSATKWCWKRLEAPLGGAHELKCALTFLEHAPDAQRASELAVRLAGQRRSVAFYTGDPASTAYGLTPLHLCEGPNSRSRAAFSDAEIEAHLAALEARQEEDGGWPISFPPASPGGGIEWRGLWTIEALHTLRRWGRI